MKYVLLSLWFIALLLYSRFAMSEPKRIALVIGNAAYAERPLVNPVNDAEDMAEVLKKLGFEVILKTDVNLRTMVDAERDFEGRLSNNSVSLFYFSGHGNQYNGNNYLIPLQARIIEENDFSREALRASEVLEKMEDKNREGVNLVFLDACRSNPFGGKRFKSGGSSKGLTLMGSHSSGSLIAYATAPGEVADDNPEGRNGIYTKHLVTALREMSRKNIFALLTQVRQRVYQESKSKQLPKEENSLMDSEFCLALEGCESTLPPVVVETPPETKKSAAEQLPPVVVKDPPTLSPQTPVCSLDLKPGTVCRDRLKGSGEGPKMVIIPAGTFQMGDIQGTGGSDEQPVHEVSVKTFAMGQYEVTFAEYDHFADATRRKKPNDSGWGRGNRPVINISWDDAVAYTEWLSAQTGKSYRLPTEAEWEYAARGGTTTAYWWGNEIGRNNANCDGCGSQWDHQKTAPVGSFKPNPFGLYDTTGNVWERTCSRYTDKYDGNELKCDITNKGHRSVRGGSWFNFLCYVRSAYRGWFNPVTRYNYGLGFRVIGVVR